MATTRAFKNLASLRNQFDDPVAEEQPRQEAQPSLAERSEETPSSTPTDSRLRAQPTASHPPHLSPLTGKIDGRRLRKVLKTPSVSLSVSVRSELYDDVRPMLFARKTTWIAVLDELLTEYPK